MVEQGADMIDMGTEHHAEHTGDQRGDRGGTDGAALSELDGSGITLSVDTMTRASLRSA